MSTPNTVLAGIGGGVAAYKAVEVVSRLTQEGLAVHVAMTSTAQRFVAPITFAAVSHRRVCTEMFPPASTQDGEDLFPHIYPASRADIFVVMPATADLLARLAAGLADDVVTCSALALPPGAVRIFCPSMHVNMWSQPVVRENARRLEAAGWVRVGPAAGALACGAQGEGRMAEPVEIAGAVRTALAAGRALAGKRVLILSGPTREHLDAVRYLGNPSSGRMGRALAQEAARRGAAVDFVTGPVEPERLPLAPGIRIHPVVSAAEMLDAARAPFADADLVLFAAAVADYAPAGRADGKPPKKAAGRPLDLQPTPDIAAALGAERRAGQVLVGFALETEDGEARAAAKRAAKQLDAVVLNGPASMGAGRAVFSFVTAGGAEAWGELDKADCARRILDWAGQAPVA